MPVATAIYTDAIQLRFTGRAANQAELNLEELAAALQGWNEFLEITQTIYFGGAIVHERLEPERRPVIRVRAFNRGSFGVEF